MFHGQKNFAVQTELLKICQVFIVKMRCKYQDHYMENGVGLKFKYRLCHLPVIQL